MVWIDRVRSFAYQTAKVAASAMPKAIVVVTSETPKVSVRLSLISGPTTLISTTASQYTAGTYFLFLNWKESTTTSTALIAKLVFVRPKPRVVLRKSAG